MFDVMSQAKNAMEAYNTKLRAITANITNMSVTGYKRTDVSFQNLFSKLLSNGSGPEQEFNQGGTNPLQIGGTAAVSSANIDFSQGSVGAGGFLDLAIKQGDGMFVVSADGGDSFLYTRAGEFQVNSDKKIVTKSGFQLYGFRKSGNSVSNQLVPIDLTGKTYDEGSITWDDLGNLYDSYDEDTGTYGNELGFKVALVNFVNPSGLRYENGTAFSETSASGAASAPYSALPNSLAARSQEESNVVYTSEIVESLEVQRALDASLTVIRMANDTITQFINKLS